MKSTYLILASVMLSAFFSGCGWLAEEATEKAVEFSASSDGKDMDIEFDGDGGMSIKSDDGTMTISGDDSSGKFEMTSAEGTITVTTGEDAEVPSDFPGDIPLFPGFKPSMVQTLPGGTTSMSGAVSATIPAVKQHYDRTAKTNGWTETGSIAEEHVASLTYTKAERMLQVTATPDMAGTMISITTGPNQ